MALLSQHLKIDALSIETVDALRRPLLMTTEPYTGKPYSISAEDFQISQLSLYTKTSSDRELISKLQEELRPLAARFQSSLMPRV